MGVTGLTPVSSPHYSPEPNNFQAVTSNPLDIDLVSHGTCAIFLNFGFNIQIALFVRKKDYEKT